MNASEWNPAGQLDSLKIYSHLKYYSPIIIYCFKNNMDPNWLTSNKPGDQGPFCFYFFCIAYKCMLVNGILQVNLTGSRESCIRDILLLPFLLCL